MSNPFNPLDWVKSAQDWFARTEKSSGFRPYLIFLILVFGLVITLLAAFPKLDHIALLAAVLLVSSIVGFIVLYTIKAFQDPEFCRSERHIERLRQIDLEIMGNESHQLKGEIIEAEASFEVTSDRKSLQSVDSDSDEDES